MDQKENLRSEIEVKLIDIINKLEHIKKIMVEAQWDFVSQEDVAEASEIIRQLMLKFNFKKG